MSAATAPHSFVRIGRLLRVPFVRFDQVPANSGEAHLLWLTVLLSLAFGGDHDPAALFASRYGRSGSAPGAALHERNGACGIFTGR
jgi:hypothetical protein